MFPKNHRAHRDASIRALSNPGDEKKTLVSCDAQGHALSALPLQAAFSAIFLRPESPPRALGSRFAAPSRPVSEDQAMDPMRSARRVALAWLLLAVAPLPAHASSHSHIEEFVNTTYKDVVNTTADWNTAAGKLQLFPFLPTLLGSYDTPGDAYAVEVSGTRAYLADGLAGLKIFDISNPASPVLLGS